VRPLGVLARAFGAFSEVCVYRQVKSLAEFTPFVACKQRLNDRIYPYEPVHVLAPSLPSRVFLEAMRRLLPSAVRTKGGMARLTNQLRVERPLWKLLRRYKPRALLIHYGWTAAAVVNVLRQSRIPYVMDLHGTDVNSAYRSPDSVYAGLLRTAFENAERCLFVSDFLRARGVRLGCPPNRCETFYRGVPVPPDPFPIVDDHNMRFIAVGRLTPVKGHHVLLEAFAQVRQQCPFATLTILGDGPARQDLQRLASDLRLDAHVRFLGFVPNDQVYEELRQACCLVQASRRLPDQEEGLPIAIQEAMAGGLPVIATRTGGIPECVSHGETGLLVEPDNPKELAEAMRAVLGSRELRASLGQKARQRILTSFNLDRQNERLADLMRGIIGKPKVCQPSRCES